MTKLIWAAGIVQLFIALANFLLPRKLRYAENLTRVDTIIRQVFIVHSIYIVGMVVGLAGPASSSCLMKAVRSPLPRALLTLGGILPRFRLA